eukprot:11323654-Heterocapsa_arctica.AAC.1
MINGHTVMSPLMNILARLKTSLARITQAEENTFVQTTITTPQDNNEGFAITSEMRQHQLKLNIMQKHSYLVNKWKSHTQEACTPIRMCWSRSHQSAGRNS